MIKNIIFDFGDVFIDLDKEATIRNIESKFGTFNLTQELIDINNKYEIGEINTNSFVEYYQNYFNTNDISFLKYAWNSIILDFPESRLDFIKKLYLRKEYKLLLLSNTNALHIEQVKDNMTVERYQAFKNCFNKFYLSHEIGFRKPNADIFQFVLNENRLNPEESLFIDDTKEHTEAAKSLGLHTWHLDPNTDSVINLFKKYSHLFDS